MDTWEQWSALLVPHPNPRRFSMSSPKNGKLRKHRKSCSTPPKIKPFAFQHTTSTIFDFDFLPPVDAVVPDTKGLAQLLQCSTSHTIMTSAGEQHSNILISNSSLVAFPMSSKDEHSLNSSASDNFNFPNPLHYISRKLTKRRRSPTVHTPSTASVKTDHPILSSSKSSCQLSAPEINDLPSPIDNPLSASTPQHAPQTTIAINSNPYQAEDRVLTPSYSPSYDWATPIAYTSDKPFPIAHNRELFQSTQEPSLRLDTTVDRNEAELASTLLPADITDQVPGLTSERALVSNNCQFAYTSDDFEPLALYMTDTDVDAAKRSQSIRYVCPMDPGFNDIDKDSGENTILHRSTEGIEHDESLPLSSLALSPAMTQQQQSPHSQLVGTHGTVNTAVPHSSMSSSFQEPEWNSSTYSKQVEMQNPPMASQAEIMSRNIVQYSTEAFSSSKADPALIQVGFEVSMAQGGVSMSPELDCGVPQYISHQTENSAVAITTFTSSLGTTVTNPENGVKYSAETSTVGGVMNAQKIYQSLKTKPKPKFIIGDLEELVADFPVSSRSTEVPDQPLKHSNTVPRPRPKRRVTVNDAPQQENRRWTVASALTDEKISDAGLVKALDRMREDIEGHDEDGIVSLDALDVEKVVLEGWGTGFSDTGVDGDRRKVSGGDGHPTLCESPSEEYALASEASSRSIVDNADRGVQRKTMKQHTRSRSTPSHAWLAAQRALLTCRELILTERHYIALLSALVQQNTSTPPPPLMCEFAKDLLSACERVLKGMEQDPSARGVAKAFLEGEEEIQEAYAKWCECVGEWFSSESSSQDSATSGRGSLDLTEVGNRVRRLSIKRRTRVGSKLEGDKSGSPFKDIDVSDDSNMNPLKRTVSTLRKSMPTLGFDTPPPAYSGDRKKDKDNETTIRKPTVRELAILPTQRVMRYVLIYQELLSHTPPTSASRGFVERAAQAAARIAEKCDLAQGNSAFIASSASNSGIRSRSSSRSGFSTPCRIPPPPPLPLAIMRTSPEPTTTGCDTAPPSPTSSRSAVDASLSRSFTQLSTQNKSRTELMMSGPRRLSASFMSMGRGRHKPKLPSCNMRVVYTPSGVASLEYHT